MYLSEVYGKGGIYAKVVAASIANGIPIYTLETKAPKFIDAEFEKHRMLSSNSSSSRAIPFKVLDEFYIPFSIRAEEKGMQGNSEVSEDNAEAFKWTIRKLKETSESYLWWHSKACRDNQNTRDIEVVHKQHLNRYLEPWMFQKKVVTATEWDNFFRLRLAPDAQPEIQELARCMKKAIELVTPAELKPGEWHLPYISNEEFTDSLFVYEDGIEIPYNSLIKCSVARCARVSYNNHDNTSPSVEKDLALYEALLSSKHMTPFEHQATPMEEPYSQLDIDWYPGVTHQDGLNRMWSGNFRGWIQNRQLVSEWNG